MYFKQDNNCTHKWLWVIDNKVCIGRYQTVIKILQISAYLGVGDDMLRKFDNGEVPFANCLLKLVVSDTHQTVDQRVVVSSGCRMWWRTSHRVSITQSNDHRWFLLVSFSFQRFIKTSVAYSYSCMYLIEKIMYEIKLENLSSRPTDCPSTTLLNYTTWSRENQKKKSGNSTGGGNDSSSDDSTNETTTTTTTYYGDDGSSCDNRHHTGVRPFR